MELSSFLLVILLLVELGTCLNTLADKNDLLREMREMKELIKSECQGQPELVPLCGCVIAVLVLLLIALFSIRYSLRSLELNRNISNTEPNRYSDLGRDRDHPVPSDYTSLDQEAIQVSRQVPGLARGHSQNSPHSYLEILNDDCVGSGSRITGHKTSSSSEVFSQLQIISRVRGGSGNTESVGLHETTSTTDSYLQPVSEHE